MEQPRTSPTSPVTVVPDSMPTSFTTPGTVEITHFSHGQWVSHDEDDDLPLPYLEAVENGDFSFNWLTTDLLLTEPRST